MQALAHLAPVELQDAALGPGLEPVLQLGQRAPVVELEQPDLDVGLGQPAPQARVVEGARGRRQATGAPRGAGVDHELAGVHPPLVRQGRARHPPAFAGGADELVVGDEHLVQLHLVELGLTGELHEGPDLHARVRACRRRRTRGPCAWRRRGRCGPGRRPSRRTARRRSRPSARRAASRRRPPRRGAHRGEVRAGVGLGEELAPQLSARGDRRQPREPSARRCRGRAASGPARFTPMRPTSSGARARASSSCTTKFSAGPRPRPP